ncbi:hypothetical protein HPDP_01055 [Candidatus Hepatincola sp. Pdp]
MDKYVVYGKNQIEVNAVKGHSLVVYAHPNDTINLNVDISSLKTSIVNGDLIIELLTGDKITIANYALMSMANEAPKISDLLGNQYNFQNLLTGSTAIYSTDDPNGYVIDRKISAPTGLNDEGRYLNSAEADVNKDGDKNKLVGNIDVDEQNPILATEIVLNTYPIRTLYNPTVYRYDVPVEYHYSAKTMFQEDEDENLPIEVLELNPVISPLYGTQIDIQRTDPTSGSEYEAIVDPIFGGGDLVGNDYAVYQYDPQVVDLTDETGDVLYRAYDGDTVVRGLNIGVTTANTYITEIRVDSLPAGVKLVGSEDSLVQDIGNGSYIITPTTNAASINVYMEYPLYMADVEQAINITVQGYNDKYDSVVYGSTSVKLDFTEVNDASDINNFNQFNTFTFSTGIDPLIVNLGTGNDTVIGSKASHTYNTGAGNDQFYSGTGNETVNLQEGNDIFYISAGNDLVNGGADSDTIQFDHSVIDITQTVVILGDGAVNITPEDFNGNVTGIVSLSNFESLVFEDADYASSIDVDNTVYIDSTDGLDGFTISFGGGDDTIVLNHATTIYADTYELATSDTTDRIIYYDGATVVENILGSNENDTLIGSNTVGIGFDAKGGVDTADYSNLAGGGIIYDSNDGSVVKNGAASSSNDKIQNTEHFIGTVFDDAFYASSIGSTEYDGYKTDGGAIDNDVVSYENETVGVIIDYTFSSEYILVSKTDGAGNATADSDKLYYIEGVKASQGNDTFVVGTDSSNAFDGFDGEDTLDYSNGNLGVTITVSSSTDDTATGLVQKSSFIDQYSHIESFIGTQFADTVIVQDSAGSLSYDGQGDNDTIDYSALGSTVGDETYIVYDFSDSNVQKYDGTDTVISTDTIDSFEIIYATANNDTFILRSATDLNLLYYVDGGNNEVVDVADVNSTGDILVLDFDNNNELLNLDNYTTVFENFESVQLGDYNNTISVSQTNNTYVHIYGGSAIDTFDAFNLGRTLIFDVSTDQIIVQDSSMFEITRLYNFEVINGGALDDTFNVTSDADSSWVFNGSTGNNVLNYGSTTVDLSIDIEAGTVEKAGGSGVDEFSNITQVIGGDGNDTFYVDPNSNITIDGGGGTRNVASFENSIFSMDVNDSDLVGQYANIQAFILTDNNDSITFTDNSLSAVPIDIEGGGSTDTVYIGPDIDGVSYIIGDTTTGGVTLDIGLASTETEKLKNFEVLNGSTGDDTYTVNTLDNSDLSSDGSLSFNGETGADTVDFSSITTGVDVRIGVTGLDFTDPSLSYISVVATGDDPEDTGVNIDYLHDIETVTLTNQDDTLYLNLVAMSTTNLSNIVIDAGAGTDTLNFSEGSNGSITFNMDSLEVTYGAGQVVDISNITGWEKVVGTSGNDTFIIADSGENIGIDGGLGIDTADYSAVSGSVTVDTINSEIIVGVGGDPADFTSIEKLRLSNQDDTIIGSTASNLQVDSSDGIDTLDYSQADVSGLSSGYLFNINGDSSYIIKDQLNSYYDLIENTEVFIGTNANDTFNVETLPTAGLSIDGQGGRDTLNISDAIAENSGGLVFDLTAEELRDATTNDVIMEISSFEVLSGTSFDDTYIVSDSTFFTEKGSITADENTIAGDTLDLTGLDAAFGVSINLQQGRLYLIDGGVIDTESYITVSSVENINLGAGDDEVIYADSVNGGITNIDGGGGNNFISFETLHVAISDDITTINVSGSTITFSNFNSYKFTIFDDNIIISDSSAGIGYTLDGYNGTNDTLDYSTYTSTGIIIDITASGTTITRDTVTDDVTNFEHFILTSGDDTINVSTGGVYNIDGSSGTDSLSYAAMAIGTTITLDFSSHIAYLFGLGGIVGYNQFSNIEEFTLTSGSDVVYIADDATDVTINGNGGSDIIDFSRSSGSLTFTEGVSGSSAVVGTATYTLDDSFVQVSGTNQDDTFILSGVGGGNYSGGQGNDTLSYAAATEGVTIDISQGTATTSAGSDDFSSMEEFIGSGFDDNFIGLNNYSVYTIDGGAGTDNVSYTDCLVAITVTVDAAGNVTIDKGLDTADNLTSIESYTGTRYNDTFTVDINGVAGITLDGSSGSDVLILTDSTLATGEGLNITYDTNGLYDTAAGSTEALQIANFETVELTDEDDELNLTLQAGNATGFNLGLGANTLTVNTAALGSTVFNYSGTTSTLNINTSTSNNMVTGTIDTLNITSTSNVDLRVSNIDFSTANVTNINVDSAVPISSLYLSSYTGLTSIGVSDSVYFNGTDSATTKGLNLTGVDNVYFTDATLLTVNYNLSATSADILLSFAGSVDINMESSTTEVDLAYNGSTTTITDGTNNLGSFRVTNMVDSTLTYSSAPTLNISINSNASINYFNTVNVTVADVSIDLSGYNGYLQPVTFAAGTTSTTTLSIAFNTTSFTTINYNGTMDLTLRSQDDELIVNDLASLEGASIDGDGGSDTVTFTSTDPYQLFYDEGIYWSGDQRVPDTMPANRFSNFEELVFDADDVYSTYGYQYGVEVQVDTDVPNVIDTVILPELYSTEELDALGLSGMNMVDTMSKSILDFNNPSGVYVTIYFDINAEDPTRVDDRLFNVDGTYNDGSSSYSVHGENVRYMYGTAGDDTFTFATLTYDQAASLAYYLSGGYELYDSEVPDGAKLYIDQDQNGNDIVDLSAIQTSDHSYMDDPNWDGSNGGIDGDYFSYKLVTSDYKPHGQTQYITLGVNAHNNTYAPNAMSNLYGVVSMEDVEEIDLPNADIIIDQLNYDNDLTIVGTKTSNPQNVAVILSNDGKTTYTDVLDGAEGMTTGTYNGTTTYDRTLYNIPVIEFGNDVSNTLVVAESGVAYDSSMVELRLSGNSSNDHNVAGNYDTVDFSNLDEGLTFTYGAWETLEEVYYSPDTYKAANATGSETFSGDVTDSEYYDWIEPIGNANALVAGIVVTDNTNYFHLNDTDGYDQSLYYRISGVEEITATSGDDTWVWGQVLYSTTDNNIYNAEKFSIDVNQTVLQVIDGSAGFDTIDVIGYNASTRANGVREYHHRELVFTYDVETNLAITQTSSGGHASYDPIMSDLEYNNFEAYISDDYGYSHADMMTGNYYNGVDDDLTINMASADAFVSGADTLEFDLGGRYFSNTSDASTMNQQTVTLDYTALPTANTAATRMSWLQDPNQGTWGDDAHGHTDSYISIDIGYNYEYSTINLKNFDTLVIKGAGSTSQTELSFNSDVSFDSLNGKTFTFTVTNMSNSGIDTTVHLYTTYNYSYDASDSNTLMIYNDADNSNDYTTGEQYFNVDFTYGYVTTVASTPESGYYFDENGEYVAPDGYTYYTDSSGSIHLVEDNSAYNNYQAPEAEELPPQPMVEVNSKTMHQQDGDATINTNNTTSNIHDAVNNFLENHENLQDALTNYVSKHEGNIANHSGNLLEDIFNLANNPDHSLHNLKGNLQNANLSHFNDFIENMHHNHADSNSVQQADATLDLNSLFNNVSHLAENNQDQHDSLISTIQNINNLSEEVINYTQQQDEANSLSFALDDMLSVGGDDHNATLSVESHSKAKSHGGSHGSHG